MAESNICVLEARNLSVGLRGKCILEDVSFQIFSGEKVSIIGPNGAGKTTLLKSLAGLIEPAANGQIFVFGKSPKEYSRRDLARLIGYVPQLGERLPSCPVYDFVQTGRYAHGQRWFGASSPEDHEGTLNMLKECGLEGFSDRDINTLSGGERQKVVIAAALAQEAPILLLDEPASFLDYRQEQEVSTLMNRLNRDFGKTIVSVVHDLNRGALEGDKIIALSHGKIVFSGSPETASQPSSLERIYDIPFDLIVHEKSQKKLVVPLEPKYSKF